MFEKLFLLALGLAAFFALAVECGSVAGVCGDESVLIWAKLSLPAVWSAPGVMWGYGNGGEVLGHCLQTIHYGVSRAEVPEPVSDTFAGAPFPGTWARCEPLGGAFPDAARVTYYWAYWWRMPTLMDKLCPPA